MIPHFFIFKVSNGDHKWDHAVFLDGKWYEFNWSWYDPNEYSFQLMSTPVDKWDGCIIREIPSADVKWVVPESDCDTGPYYTHINPKWLKNNFGIEIPE